MSDKAPESKIDDDNLRLLRDLEQRNVVEVYRIRRECSPVACIEGR